MERNRPENIYTSFCFLIVSLAVVFVASAAADVEETNLGVPIHSVTIPAAAIGPDLEGGYFLYVVANGNPAIFTVVEVPSGRQVHSEPLPGVHASWSMDVADDGSVYIGTNRNGHLYRWRPGDESGESVAGSRVAGQTHLYGTVVGSDGKVYGGTYPDGRVFRFDPESGEVRDYGSAFEGVNYVRAVAFSDGMLYAGTYPEAHLVAIDAASGEKRELPLPPGGDGWISHLTAVEGLLFARSGERLAVFDLAEEAWIGEGPAMAQFSQVAYFEDEQALLVTGGDRWVRRYDFQSGETTHLGVRASVAPRGFEVARLDQDKFPGYTLVGSGMRGHMWTYHLATGELETVEPEIEGVPISIRSMAGGPDGNVYIAGYLSPQEFARFDPDVGEIEKLPFGGQMEAMVVHQNELYLGRYPGASVLAYDPEKPVSGSNPRTLFQLQEYGQARPFGFASAGDRLAVGTVPEGGRLGGVLALYDSGSGNLVVHEGVVEGQSIVSLAYRDGLLYGGTTVWGGLGIEPAAEEARLFIWDLEKDEKIWEGVPAAGEKAISHLTFDPHGNLWGITAATIFRFDPKARVVTEVHELFPYGWPGTFWKSSYLEYDDEAGKLYGTAAGRFFSFDPASGASRILAQGAGYFARDRYGNFYYSRGVDLIQARLSDGDGDDHAGGRILFEENFGNLDNWTGPTNNEDPIRVMQVTEEDSELFFGEPENPYLRLYKDHPESESNAITANNVFSEPSEVVTISFDFWDNPDVGPGRVTMRVSSPQGVTGNRRTHEIQFDNGSLAGVAGAYKPGVPNSLQVVMNNSHDDVDYLDGKYTVASDRFDIWVNGVRVGDDLANRPEVTYEHLPVGTPLGSLQFAIWTVSRAELLVDNLVVYEGAAIANVAGQPRLPAPLIEFTFEGESLRNTGVLAGEGEFGESDRVPDFAPGLAGGTALDNLTASGMGSLAEGGDGTVRFQPGSSFRSPLSLTITGWFRHEEDFAHDAFLFGKPNSIHLFGRDNNLRLDLRDAGDASRWLLSATPWHRETGRWIFFAVTADLTDATAGTENAFMYYAYEDSDGIVLDSSASLSPGAVRSVSHEITFANNYWNNRPFHGLIDNFRVWGSAQDGSGALSAEQIEAVWRRDIALEDFPVDVPRIVHINRDGQAFSISFETEAGRSYIIEYNDELDDATWTELFTRTGDGEMTTVTDFNATVDRRFYRVRLAE